MSEEIRANPYLIRERTGFSKGEVNTAFSNLTSAGWVTKVTRGLYEFVEDPRRGDDSDDITDSSLSMKIPPETTERVEPHTHTPEEIGNVRDRAEARLKEVNVPGRPASVERTRRKAIMYAWGRLREEGQMSSQRLANDTFGQFFEDPDLNYSTSASRYPGYQMWDNCVRDVLRELPGVHAGTPWTFKDADE
jgi:hypothetical protein